VLGVIFAVGGATSLLGAVAVGRVTAALGLGPTMIVGLALTAVGQGLIVPATGATLAAVTLLIAQQMVSDPAATIYDVVQTSVRQAVTPERLLGRVNASLRVLETGAMLLGALAGGLLGDGVGLRPTLALGAGTILLAAGWLALSPVRRLQTTPG